jgi:hypothetical protein
MTDRAVLAVALAALLRSAPASAESPNAPTTEERARVALVWIFGDDDVFNPPDASEPPSPAANIGDRPGYDPIAPSYDSRYTGRENRFELRLEAAAPGLVPSLSTRAELALGIDASGFGDPGDGPHGDEVRAEDLGSFVEIGVSLAPPPAKPAAAESDRAVHLRLYPIDGDIERVGWLEALAWGGATGVRRESPYASARGPVRAARLSLAVSPLVLFAGLKTATFLEPVSNAPAVEETSYGAYGGVAARPVRWLELGIAGGVFEHGKLEGAARGTRATTAGGSARIVIQRGMPVPPSPVSFLGHGDDPFRYGGHFESGSFAFGGEIAALVQRVRDFERPGRTTLSPARAGALFGAARLGAFEPSVALLVRDPEFIMRNVPGVFPGQSTPQATQRELERTLLVSSAFAPTELVRIDVSFGLRFPAAIMSAALDRLGQPTGATLVLNDPGDVAPLPAGTVPVPVLDVRTALEVRLSALLSSVIWFQCRRDYNRTKLVVEAGEVTTLGFATPDRFGYGLAARAAW